MSFTPYVKAVALSYMEALSSPVSLSCSIMIKYGEWDQLVNKTVDPVHYNDASSFRPDYLAVNFLRKFDGIPTSIDKEKVTTEKWWDAERSCYITNERLSPFLHGAHPGPHGERISEFITNVQKWIISIIGYGPPSSLRGRFGPGATMSDSSRRVTIFDKLSSTPTLTTGSVPFLSDWHQTAWGRSFQKERLYEPLSFVRGNAFFMVPKDSRALRPCAKEPSINGFLQLGAGRFLRNRLASRAGLDLNEGQQLHNELARKGSLDGSVATIDLSSASDTVCNNLVKLFLPTKWYDYLNALRSPFTFVNGKWVRLEKFSSMGNGFTFELETLIFASIVHACGGAIGASSFVYGDDIIVPTSICEDVLAALSYFGFTPNSRKTFTKGYFRESCGGDFFNGVDVRPYYFREEPDEPQKLIGLANGICAALGIHSIGCRVPRSFVSVRNCILNALPRSIRFLRGPKDLGDLVLHDTDETTWNVRWRDSIRYLRVYRPAKYRYRYLSSFTPEVQLYGALYLAGSETPRSLYKYGADGPSGVIPRDGVSGFKIGWLAFS